MVPEVRKTEKNEGVPANHAKIKQVGDPHEFPHPKNDENSNYLTEQDSASRTEYGCEAPHQRIDFESAEMKCDQRRYQVEHLQHDKAGSGGKDVSNLHAFKALEPGFATGNHYVQNHTLRNRDFREVPSH